MNNLLLLSILQVVQKGQFFGFHPVKNDIQKWETFMTITDQEFLEHWNHLIENTCLIETGQGNVRMNNEKDCVKYYTKVVTDANENIRLKNEIVELNRQLAAAQLKDIPVNAIDRKTLIIWQIIAAVGIVVSFLLKLFGVKGWL